MFASLRVRFLLVTTLLLLLFAISAGWILRQSFDTALRDRAQEQLKLHVYGLLSAAEFRSGKLELPQMLAEPRFNQLQSGLVAQVTSAGKPVWRSQSFIGAGAVAEPYTQPGQWHFDEIVLQNQRYFRAVFTVIWEHRKKETPFSFMVWESDAPYVAQISGFEDTLWQWLGGLICLSVALVFLMLYLGFRPFARLADAVRAVEQGERPAIEGNYPAEVRPVVQNFNRLLTHERHQRERYQHSLGDLAHSLKTPLAVMRGLDLAAPEKSTPVLQQQISRMDEIISYQLRRAMTAAPALQTQGTLLDDVVPKLTGALQKVYADRQPQFQCTWPDQCRIPLEQGDAFELLGNLLDNACKHGAGRVRVTASLQGERCVLLVENDGQPVPEHERQRILQRGVRRDEQAPGQGIGLAVVQDIVAAYGGSLSVDDSTLGGAAFRIELPR